MNIRRIILSRDEIEQNERQFLAPYAALSTQSRGRVYPQPDHPLRTAFQRDRDRIVHSTAFRRLEYKTQVFIPHERDHYRTRLTHTIEVAQISRTLARNLRLNEDLAEAVALAHDLGHTPFGHAGEEVLDELLEDLGGFNHNRQSLRVVDKLEQRYAQHPGLNLSFEVREGIAKHETSVRISVEEFNIFRQPTLEAALVDVADEIAYNSHDIDDGLTSGLLALDDLKEAVFWQGFGFQDDQGFLRLTDEHRHHELVRRLVDRMATDVITHARNRLEQLQIKDLPAVRNCAERICRYSPTVQPFVDSIKSLLRHRLYEHLRLQEPSKRARVIIETLFERIRKDISLMPPRFRNMLADEKPQIVIADYIAGMTDRYAEKVYAELK
ncbi:MAG: deoxyguanosinetriphosphate triphosphohydrolase [bacterium]